jgi:O-antigen/teichoic acid export membrane protein
MRRLRELARGDHLPSVWAAVATITSTATRFMTISILGRTLSQADFGRFAYLQWLVDFVFVVTSLGFCPLTSRFLSEFRDRKSELSEFVIRWWKFALAVPFGSTLAVYAIYSDPTGHDANLRTITLWLFTLVLGLQTIAGAALSGLQAFRTMAAVTLTQFVCFLVAMLLMQSQDGLLQASQAYILSGGVSIGISLYAIRKLLEEPLTNRARDRGVDWKVIRTFALFMWSSGILSALVWSRGELPVANLLLTPNLVGEYVKSFSIFSAGVSVIMLGVSGASQKITRLLGGGDSTEARVLSNNSFTIQLCIANLISSLFIWFATEITFIIFGSFSNDSLSSLRILSISLPTLAVSAPNAYVQVRTNGRFQFFAVLLSLFPLYTLSFILGDWFGISGIAASRAVTLTTISLATIIGYQRLQKDSTPPQSLPLLLSIAVHGACTIAIESISEPALLTRVLCFLVYLSLFFALQTNRVLRITRT